jgi:hypothetical protein
MNLETPKLFASILDKPEIVDFLIEYYDFEVIESISNTEEFYFKVEEKAKIVAQDASGGIFALIGESELEKLPVIYVSFKGQAGKIAKSFNDFLSIMLACPYWRDL